MSCSSSGLTALALASEVLMRSCWMTSLQRFASSALRCEALRLSLWRVFWWRIAGGSYLVVAEVQAAGVQGLDDLVDRLFAEVGDRVELALGLRDEVADGLDAGTLEAVVRAHAELELLDEDVVHRPRRAAAAVERARAVALELAGRTGAQLLDAVGVGEDRQLRDEDLGGLAQRGLRVDRPVGLDVERELVVVGALADARLLDRVRHAAHGREDRVDRDDADRLVGRLVVLRRAVAAATADREVELELGLLLERGDVDVGVEDLHAGGQVDVRRGDLARAGDDQRRLDLGGVRVHAAHDALEVEDDVGHVLGDALDGRELVGDALDAHARHGRAGQGAQQNSPQRVTERVAESAVQRLDGERAAVLLHVFGGDSGNLEVEHRGPDCRFTARRAKGEAARFGVSGSVFLLLRVQLDDELLLDRRRDLTALGLAQHLGGERVMVRLQPGWNLGGQLGGVADDRVRTGAGLDGDHVAVADLIAGDIHAPAVDGPVAVADELARLAPRGGEAEAHEDVVEAALEEREEVLARDALLAGGAVVVAGELLLEHAVVALGLLLLAQLDAVLGLLLAAAAVVAGRVGAAFHAALVGQAALALEEELLPFAAALLALGTGVSSHARPPRLGAACEGGSRCGPAG